MVYKIEQYDNCRIAEKTLNRMISEGWMLGDVFVTEYVEEINTSEKISASLLKKKVNTKFYHYYCKEDN